MVQCIMLGGMTTPPSASRVVVSSDLIGVTEAAALMHVDRSTVTRRISSGKLTPVAVLAGGIIVLDRSDVEAVIRRDRNAA